MLKVARAWIRRWPAGHVIFLLATAGILLWQLGSQTAGISAAEVAARQAASQLSDVFNQPLNAPYNLLEHFLVKLWPNSQFGLRLPSAVVAIVMAWCFYKLAVNWFGRLIGLFGSLIFLSTPLFIILGRQATADILFFTPIILMWLFAWLIKAERSRLMAWLMLLIAVGLAVYTPGLIWWIIAAAIICRQRLMTAIDAVPVWVSGVGLSLSAAIMAPLGIALAKHPHLIKSWLLIPQSWPAPLVIAKHLGWMVLALFVRAPEHTPIILGRLALISVPVLALAVFGIYAMGSLARIKAATLALNILFAVLAAGINNNLALLSLGLPAILLLASAGLRYLYIEWRGIFPRNPVPKSFALLLIAAVTVSQLYLGVRYALVAWPHSSATRSAYVLK